MTIKFLFSYLNNNPKLYLILQILYKYKVRINNQFYFKFLITHIYIF